MQIMCGIYENTKCIFFWYNPRYFKNINKNSRNLEHKREKYY